MTRPSSPTFSNAIPEDEFAVILDTERFFIVDSGRYSDMVAHADHLNEIYHSQAYSAKRWIEGRIW